MRDKWSESGTKQGIRKGYTVTERGEKRGMEDGRSGEETPTASGMRPALWIQADFTAWKKSTTPSVLSLSN